MKPRFETKPEFSVLGMASYYTMSTANEIPKLWDDFIPAINNIEHKIGNHCYGVCDMPKDLPEGSDFRYTACVEIEKKSKSIHEGMVVQIIPANDYVVFTHKGPISKINKTYDYIYKEWLPKSEYSTKPFIDFEFYGEKFNSENPMDENSEVDIFVTLIKK